MLGHSGRRACRSLHPAWRLQYKEVRTAVLSYAQVSPTRFVPEFPAADSHRRFGYCLGCVCSRLPPKAAPIAGPVRAQHLTVELLPLHDSIQPGGSDLIGLHFTLDRGWHDYWINAGDSGEPPTIKWTLPAGITAGAMQFPAPRRLPLGPLMDFGYEDEVLFPITLSADSTLKVPSTASLSAHVNWLVCREVCIPGKADLALPLQVAAQQGPTDSTRAALFDRFHSLLPQALPSSSKAVFATTPSGFALALTGHPATTAQFFPLDESQIANAAPQPVEKVDGGVQISLKRDVNFKTQLAQLNGVLLLGDGTAYEVHAVPGPLPAAAGASSAGFLKLLRFLSLAFLGGVILNLMPCVFPVLFIKGLSPGGGFASSPQPRPRSRPGLCLGDSGFFSGLWWRFCWASGPAAVSWAGVSSFNRARFCRGYGAAALFPGAVAGRHV